MNPSSPFRREPRVLLCLSLVLPGLLTAQVDTVKVVSEIVSRKTRLPGEMLPFMKVGIQARVTGFVDAVEVDRGSMVKKGQLLVKLSAPELAAQIAEAEAKALAVESQRAEAEAKLVAAQSTADRLKAASATPGVVAANELVLSEKAVDAGRALVKAMEAAAVAARSSVKPLREMLTYLDLRAPFDGVITARTVHPGALVGPGAGDGNSPLLTLEQVSRLRLVVAVPEADVAAIAVGTRVSFKTPAHPGQSFSATVARIPRSLDAKTRSMPIELDVANSNGVLAPGMYPEVEWPAKRTHPSLLVPPAAVATNTERSFVIRVNGGKAEWVNVSKGVAFGDLVEVLGPLAAGDIILKRASDEIREGSAIQVRAPK
ncbi:MAG: efflux RND transporter periplasmic adaptor subunit [Acidobacteriia bacterium]|nr:efflux RND transporter periplasmic adaptor subunit [Terriglobia bacterium]